MVWVPRCTYLAKKGEEFRLFGLKTSFLKGKMGGGGYSKKQDFGPELQNSGHSFGLNIDI